MLKQNILYQALTTQSTHSEEAAAVEVVLFEPNGPEGDLRVQRCYMRQTLIRQKSSCCSSPVQVHPDSNYNIVHRDKVLCGTGTAGDGGHQIKAS